jgi:hypothetical protein
MRPLLRRLLGELSPPLFDPPIRALFCSTYERREKVALELTLRGMLVHLSLDAAEGLGWLHALEGQPQEDIYAHWRAELARIGAGPRALRSVDAWLSKRRGGAVARQPALGALILDEQTPAARSREHYQALMVAADERQVPLVFYPRTMLPSIVDWPGLAVIPANVLSWPPRPDAICATVERIRREQLTRPEVTFERYFRRFSPE